MSLEPDEKLIWLGLKRPSQAQSEVQTEVTLLKENVGSYDSFQTGVSNQASYSDFKSYLTSNGFTSAEADAFIDKIKNNFTDTDSSGTSWDEFEDYVVNQTDSYEEFITGFGNLNTIGSELTTTDGDKIAGIRFFENAGVTKDGVAAPKGAVEVFGAEIHFSQTANPATSLSPLTYSNISTNDADDTVTTGSSITISADVTNPNSVDVDAIIPLTEDGTTIDSKHPTISASSTESLSFTVTKSSAQCHDYAIGGSSTILVCWSPGGFD